MAGLYKSGKRHMRQNGMTCRYSNPKFASKFPRIPPTKGRDTLVVWMPSFPYLPHTLICMYSSFHRPVAGGINFCPLALDTVEDDDEIIAIAMPELTHALVRLPLS